MVVFPPRNEGAPDENYTFLKRQSDLSCNCFHIELGQRVLIFFFFRTPVAILPFSLIKNRGSDGNGPQKDIPVGLMRFADINIFGMSSLLVF